ncbi:MAG: nucleotidyl transferase AbiEii/AbiGii toxin family protein [Planctomycetota bacterium]|jgi:hypothetical protein|nr:nucleotidyl transferase AbiEii/AbiGii toxin family protein [Planctomycetota bacterium]
MKYGTHQEYSSKGTNLVEQSLLTVWASLSRWHDDLVLIGGLVPRYLCGDISEQRQLPRPVTIDADLGIALGASSGQYEPLSSALQGHGFKRSEKAGHFEKSLDASTTVFIDFLVEHPPHTEGTATVDDIHANILPGVNRALKTARSRQVSGMDLYGAKQNLTIRVCEIGPFLALKLRAFHSRRQPKDAFDILYVLKYYDGGIERALRAFADECRLQNPAAEDAITSLERHFQSEDSSAPLQAAHFVLGEGPTGISEERVQIQQEVVDAGHVLLRAARDAMS